MAVVYDGRGRKFPIVIARGTDVAFALTVTDAAGAPVDMTSATVAATIFTKANATVVSFTSAVSGAGSNVVTLSLTDTQTAALTATGYQWSLLVTRGGDTRAWFAGGVTVVDSDNGGGSTSGSRPVTVDSELNVNVNVAAIGGSGGGGSDADVAGYVNDPASATTTALAAQYVSSDDVREIVVLTQAEFVALTPDPETLYHITDATSAYQPLDSDLTAIAAANNGAVLAATTASFTTADESKLDGIAPGATAGGVNEIWIGAGDLATTTLGTLTYTDVNRTKLWSMAVGNAALTCSVFLPSDWTTYHVDFYFTNLGAGTGNVPWEFRTQYLEDASSLAAFGTGDTATPAAPAQNVVRVTRLATGKTATAGKMLSMNVVKLATGETLGNASGFIGVRLLKAS